ncbi:MAG TPA: HAMP domain-containing sensor histidine kinase [Streptosporangiaceae bacterium]|nr:HAMP domain-containing sensor histidine kinase [Streptosporangiaceae bacterium]
MASNALTRLSQRTPLRVKLITALLALVALALAIISFTSTSVFQGYLQHQADLQLQGLMTTSQNRLANFTSGNNLGAGGSNNPYLSIPGYVVELLDPNGNHVGNFGTMGQLTGAPPDIPDSAAWLNAHENKPVTVQAQRGNDSWRILIDQIPNVPVSISQADGGHVTESETVTLVVGQQIGDIDRPIGYLGWLDLVVSLAIMLGLGVVSVAVVRTNLRPLDDIEETAQDIAAGHLDRRVPDRDPRTEVGRLGQSINTMLTQIETAFHSQQASEEAAVQSEERMRRFIADASHELRTPITAIRGFAEYYRQRGGVISPEEGSRGSLAPEDLDRIMQRVEGEAARMGVLVEDLLLLARMDQQRPIEHRPVDLLVLAADAVQDSRMIAPGRTVRLDVEPGQAFLVNGDEARLRQVISNLTSNALKYTPDESPIEVRLRAGLMPGQPPFPGDPAPSVPAAILEVADQGPGLTPEQAQRVFERFYRADTHRNRNSGGSGLGLAIVSALVAAHGGTATVESEPGQGATFRITLPLAPDAASGPADQDEQDEAAPDGPGQSDTVSFGS